MIRFASMSESELPEFVVVENTPGTLPESDPVEFVDYVDARNFVASLAAEFIEAGYVIDWNGRNTGFWAIDGDLTRRFPDRVVEILPAP